MQWEKCLELFDKYHWVVGKWWHALVAGNAQRRGGRKSQVDFGDGGGRDGAPREAPRWRRGKLSDGWWEMGEDGRGRGGC